MKKNLIFDLGGVIVDIERNRCVEAFARLGLTNADSYFGDYAQTGVFMQIEDGTIGVDEFHRYLRQRLPGNVSNEQIDAAFQKFIIGIPEHRLAALRSLRREGFRLYLLSNTNPVMWNGILAEQFRKEGLERADYFDGMVTSFEARSAKPDTEIFLKLMQQYDLKPGECVFFDDGRANVNAATSLGIESFLVKPGTEFIDIINNKRAGL